MRGRTTGVGLRVATVALIVGVALVSGAVVALLSDETAGIATLLVIPVCILIRRRRRSVARFLVPFGCGYIAAIAFLAVKTSGLFSGSFSVGTAAYAASQLAIGAAILIVGVLLLLRSRGADAKGGLVSRQAGGTCTRVPQQVYVSRAQIGALSGARLTHDRLARL
jgi:hypothetical protein